jgi:hypothetical protein
MGRRARFVTFVIAVGLTAGVRASQNDSIEQRIRLRFPDGADLTGLWVNYFLRGPFGGYGGNGRLDPGTREYVISTSHDGRPAATFEAIVYVPGIPIRCVAQVVGGQQRNEVDRTPAPRDDPVVGRNRRGAAGEGPVDRGGIYGVLGMRPLHADRLPADMDSRPYDVEDLSARGRAAELPIASQYPLDLQLVVVPRP